MSFFQRSVGRRFFHACREKEENDLPTFLLPALYPARLALDKHFFRDLSENIQNGPNCLVSLAVAAGSNTRSRNRAIACPRLIQFQVKT
jgi:hypothetical protein